LYFMDWAKSSERRDQLVLFPTRLDDAISGDHHVRLLDEILHQLDWSKWELRYDLKRGQPPIHPRILSSVILYGLLTRIRSSRMLEEALQVRLDFRWLVEGRSIDHTTICEFRRKNAVALKDTFVQIGLLARELGYLQLHTLAFDGTRIRANNRRRGTRTPERLRELEQELANKYTELETQVAASDASDDEIFDTESAHTLPDELADVRRRQAEVRAALAELNRLKEAGEKVPKRQPTTDPESRVMPNKHGGFAPNYTPLATVDVDSGLIVSADVIANTDEDHHMISAIEDVQEQFGLESPPPEMLADGMMATGENLAECAARGIELYSPLKGQPEDNPALRDDLTQAVAAEDRDRLPSTIKKPKKGPKYEQLDKHAFIYDKKNNCYWCPEGKILPYKGTTHQQESNGRPRERRRYQASSKDCTACPLLERCVQSKSKTRSITREQHEEIREAHAVKMSTKIAKEKYARRCHPGERPFAVIKQTFNARQFLLRGLKKVKQEWRWLTTAFNLNRLIGLLRSGVGPPETQPNVLPIPPPQTT
jgi:transposase